MLWLKQNTGLLAQWPHLQVLDWLWGSPGGILPVVQLPFGLEKVT